jgi:hypothetical protein
MSASNAARKMALLRDGLLDEVSLNILPFIDRGSGTRSSER